MKRLFAIAVLLLAVLSSAADTYKVHVVELTATGAETNVITDAVLEAGSGLSYTTSVASAISGYVFTHWSISTGQETGFVNRDAWGRALDAAIYTLYEITTNTANYISVQTDEDGDGLADGNQLYWHGNLDVKGGSDLDEDGFAFCDEVSAGTNPLFADSFGGGMSVAMGLVLTYEPKWPFVTRYEPENMFYSTVTNRYYPGTVVSTPSIAALGRPLAYWLLDGGAERDYWGRAVDVVSVVMPSNCVEVVGVCESDPEKRDCLYWYGDCSVSLSSDTDGDGRPFSVEIEAGTNPHFADAQCGGPALAVGATVWYNPNSYPTLVIANEPGNPYVDPSQSYVKPGTPVTLPIRDANSFWYWKADGVWVNAPLASSGDSILFTMPGTDAALSALVDMAYDYDGDGFTHEEEMSCGSNPYLFDSKKTGASIAIGDTITYNPFSYHWRSERSEPEGALVETRHVVTRCGDVVQLPIQDDEGSIWYWKCDGEWIKDCYNADFSAMLFTMPSHDVELIAVQDYGCDVDSDGFSHSEEVAAGTNPILPDRYSKGVSAVAVGETIWFNPNNYPLEEETAGTNPTLPDRYSKGVSAVAVGKTVWFNPSNYPWCSIRNDIDDSHVGAMSRPVRPGVVLELPIVGSTSNYWFWLHNGVAVDAGYNSDLSVLLFTMPCHDVELVATVDADLDFDGDGFNYSEEMAGCTSPFLFDWPARSALVMSVGEVIEVDLQPHEQVQGAIIDDQFKHFFTSPIAGNEARSETFGEDLRPIVWDLNGDGLFDLVLVYKGGYKTFINVGYHGNPEFEERKDVSTNGVDVAMNDVARLLGLSLDVATPEDALSATTNGTALLVSDSAGRIWYYQQATTNNQLPSTNYQLQHKVWGGSHAGFAEGLRLAAVDWDEDGDLDCLAGTAAGKLMLLRDPKVGRPTNLKAEAGVDTVVLTWDPNQQSRIRGYRVYRSRPDDSGASPESRIAEPQLPTYRDAPPEITSYDYKVSSVSRFYTAGNSTPTITESPPTEAVRATLGGVTFNWLDVNTKVGERVEVVLSIENALNYNVAGKSQVITYDPQYLRPVEVLKSGLTEGIVLESAVARDGDPPGGVWNVTMTSGILPAGSGRFLTFAFEALAEGTTTVGGAAGDRATVSIAARSASVPYQLGDVDGDGDVDEQDLRLLAKLKSAAGRKYTADQLKAGDFNGNGKLDNDDYQALRALLKEKGL